MAPKTCLIINPAAGKKAGVTTNALGVDDVTAILKGHGIDADVLETERAGHGTELARQAVRDGYERVVAAGGDGTVTEIAEGLVGSDAVLGVLPLGSVMNIARMLGIPRDLDGAAEVIERGRVMHMDAGRAHGGATSQFFIEAAGVGIDAGIFAFANEVDRGNWRVLGPLVRYVIRYRPRRIQVRLDGKVSRFRAMMVSVANGPFVGAALTMAPDAQLDDGYFDVRIFTRFSKVELIRHFVSIVGGRRAYNPKVLLRRARVVEIHSRRPLMAHADSHPIGSTPARFELIPRAIRVTVGGADIAEGTEVAAGASYAELDAAESRRYRPPLTTPTH